MTEEKVRREPRIKVMDCEKGTAKPQEILAFPKRTRYLVQRYSVACIEFCTSDHGAGCLVG